MAVPLSGDEIVKPSPVKLTLVMVGICLAVFLTGMDQTILATAIPVISVDFNTSVDFGWWSNAYFLTLSSFQLFYGKLYSLFPIKLIYLIAIAIFEIGSLVCTTAPNSVALIVGRAIAGLGAAGVFSGSVLILTKIIPLSQRATYLGIISAFFGLAAIVGPFIGAAILQSTTWKWCFGINLPLGAVTVVLCFLFVHTPLDPSAQSLSFTKRTMQLDISGTVCMVGSLMSLLIALQWGGAIYPWNNGRIIALFVVSGILAILFIGTQVKGSSRTIPRSLARNRDIWLAGSYSMCITGGVYVAILYLPVWFQEIRGRSPLSSGEILTPLIAGYVVGSIVAGGITSGFKYYNPSMIIGTILSGAGSALLTTIDLDTSTARIVGYQLIYGFGIGFGFGQPSYLVQTVLPPADVPIGVTFITLVQNLSSSIFVAVAQSIFQGELHKNLEPLMPSSSNSSSLLLAALPKILSSLPIATQAAAKDIISYSIIRTMYVSLALSCCSVVGALAVKWIPMTDVFAESTGEDSYVQSPPSKEKPEMDSAEVLEGSASLKIERRIQEEAT